MQKTRKVVRARVGLVEDWQYMIELIWLLRTRVWTEVESIDDWRPPEWGLNWGLRLTVSIISFNPFSPTNKFGAFAAVYFLVTFDMKIRTKNNADTNVRVSSATLIITHKQQQEKEAEHMPAWHQPNKQKTLLDMAPAFVSFCGRKIFFFSHGRCKKSLVFLPGRRKIISFRQGRQKHFLRGCWSSKGEAVPRLMLSLHSPFRHEDVFA